MTLCKLMACLGALGAVVIASSCASAQPVYDARPPLPPPPNHGGDYELQVLVDGVPAPTFWHGNGTYVLGQHGERYTLRIINHTGRRIEAVVSVDGRDVVDGRPADYRNKRGYLVPAWGQMDIDGWRLSTFQAAAFRFSTVARSYAARTGSARDVGVIGAAIFSERYVPQMPPRMLERPYPYPTPAPGPGPAPAPESYRSRGEAAPPAAADAGRGSASEGGAAPSLGPGPSMSRAPAPESRPGLGTEFGEAVSSPVEEVAFFRANPSHPDVVLGVRYNDRPGLVALGINVEPETCYGGWCDGETNLRQTATPFPAVDRFAAPPSCWRETGCYR